jgi:hypothetical protein
MYKTQKRRHKKTKASTKTRIKYKTVAKNKIKSRRSKKYKGGFRLCNEHKIFVKNDDGSLNKELSLRGTIDKFNCYQNILNNPSHNDKHHEIRKQYDSLIQMLIDNFYSGKDIFLKYLIKDNRYKTLSDKDLKTLLIPLTRMQEDAVGPSMPIIEYILRDRGLSIAE